MSLWCVSSSASDVGVSRIPFSSTPFFRPPQLSADWEIVQGDDCLGVETLCDFEVQTFHTRGTGVEGGTLLLKASVEEVTTTQLVAEAVGGMVHTKGGCSARRFVIVCIFSRASFGLSMPYGSPFFLWGGRLYL